MRRRGRHARGTVTITTAHAAIIVQALADAEQYRRHLASDWCDACVTSPAQACESHLDDLDQADAYRGLAQMLTEEGR